MPEKNLKELYFDMLSQVYGRLNAYALSLTRNSETAGDLLSETVLTGYERFGSLKNRQAFLSFLFTIMYRINALRLRNKYKMEYSHEVDFDEIIKDDLTPEDATDVSILYEKLDKLPSNQKEAFILFELMGLSQKEIAEVQMTTLINIKLRIHRAKIKLRNMLKDEETGK